MASLSRLTDALLELTSLLAADMSAGLGRLGLTETKAHVLWVLRDGPVTQRALADALGVTPRAVTGIVDALAEAGLVRREPHPTDRRATWVTPTERGRAVTDGFVAGRQDMEALFFADESPADLEAFGRVVDGVTRRVRARLEQGTA